MPGHIGQPTREVGGWQQQSSARTPRQLRAAPAQCHRAQQSAAEHSGARHSSCPATHLCRAELWEGGDGNKVHLAHVEKSVVKNHVVLLLLRYRNKAGQGGQYRRARVREHASCGLSRWLWPNSSNPRPHQQHTENPPGVPHQAVGGALCSPRPHARTPITAPPQPPLYIAEAALTCPILRVSHLVEGFLWGTCTTKAVGCTKKLKPCCRLMCIRCCTLFLQARQAVSWGWGWGGGWAWVEVLQASQSCESRPPVQCSISGAVGRLSLAGCPDSPADRLLTLRSPVVAPEALVIEGHKVSVHHDVGLIPNLHRNRMKERPRFEDFRSQAQVRGWFGFCWMSGE